MLVKILSKFNCQSYPLDETAIEVEDEVLEQIGKTKCFDLDTLSVVDYDNSKDLKIKEIEENIANLKGELQATDYIAIKYAEGIINYSDYLPMKSKRQFYRDEINRLEELKKTLI